MRAPNQYTRLRAAGRGLSPVVCYSLGELERGCWSEKVFLQNEAIMSFRINKSNGFVLGLIGFVWLKSHCKANRGH